VGWQDHSLLIPPHSSRCGTVPLDAVRDRVGSGWGTPNTERPPLMEKKMKDQHTKKTPLDGSGFENAPCLAEPSRFLQACLLHSIIITSCVLVPCLQQRIHKWKYLSMSKSRARTRLRKLEQVLERSKNVSRRFSLACDFKFVLLCGSELKFDILTCRC